jgi:hypothetical protein
MRVQDRRNTRTLEAGKRMYDGYRVKFLKQTGNSQSDILKIVIDQRDFTRHLLARFHQRIMRTELPKGPTTEAWVEKVNSDHDQFFGLLGEWLGSPEYSEQMAVKRHRSDNQFIRSLYFDLLERAPEYQEFRNMRNALLSMADPTPLRAVMARVILDSGQARIPPVVRGQEEAFVQDAFLRYLGREPTQSEGARFASILKKPGTTGVHVVLALVTSTEYQYY